MGLAWRIVAIGAGMAAWAARDPWAGILLLVACLVLAELADISARLAGRR